MLIYILAGLCAVFMFVIFGLFMRQAHAFQAIKQAIDYLQSEYGDSYKYSAEATALRRENSLLKITKSEIADLCKFLLSKENSDRFFVYDGKIYAKYSAELKEEPSGERILNVEFTEVNV